jgi:hypothetical protein
MAVTLAGFETVKVQSLHLMKDSGVLTVRLSCWQRRKPDRQNAGNKTYAVTHSMSVSKTPLHFTAASFRSSFGNGHSVRWMMNFQVA